MGVLGGDDLDVGGGDREGEGAAGLAALQADLRDGLLRAPDRGQGGEVEEGEIDVGLGAGDALGAVGPDPGFVGRDRIVRVAGDRRAQQGIRFLEQALGLVDARLDLGGGLVARAGEDEGLRQGEGTGGGGLRGRRGGVRRGGVGGGGGAGGQQDGGDGVGVATVRE